MNSMAAMRSRQGGTIKSGFVLTPIKRSARTPPYYNDNKGLPN
jgi:hypothetical protein